MSSVDELQIEELRAEEADVVLRLSGPLDTHSAPRLLRMIRGHLRKQRHVLADLSGLNTIDSAGIATLAECAASAAQRHGTFAARGATGTIRDALARTPAPRVSSGKDDQLRRISRFERWGAAMLATAAATRDLLQLLADTLYWGLVAPLRGRFPPPGAISTQALRIGADALPIVSLLGFLLGLTVGFQAAHQLQQFGANIYLANFVGVSIVRELGPLLTAIIVAGRSGSAIAAELGTMVVGEEIDALRAMGIEPVRFLVVPRVFAITVTQPLLTVYSNAVGLLGGFMIGTLFLDLSPVAYLNQTLIALKLSDLLIGLCKSLCFAWVIVFTGCHCGLRIRGGAVGVGRATTTSVVAGIFAIIVVDSTFTTLTTVLG